MGTTLTPNHDDASEPTEQTRAVTLHPKVPNAREAPAGSPQSPMGSARFGWPIRVYWEDTDAGGVVYHANYLKFLERARSEWLRTRGVVQSTLASAQGRLFAIVAMDLRFRQAARLDDELTATVRLTACRGASLEFTQELIRDRDGALLVTATVKAACLDAERFVPRPIPKDILSLLGHA